jgi:hypothetical protein
MIYDCILIGSGPVNLIEAMFLSKQGKKVLVLEQSEYIGGAWGKVPLKEGLPEFQLGCHIWDVEPKAFSFLSEFLDMKLVKMKPQPEFVFKGVKLPYDWKNLLFYIRGKLRPKSGMESVSFNKARIIPAIYIYPAGGSLQFIDRLLDRVKDFGIEIRTGIKIDTLEIGGFTKAISESEIFDTKEIVITSVSQLRSISKNGEEFKFPKPELVDYIHGHFLVNDVTSTKFSYARLPGNPLIHRISDETDHVISHGINMTGKKLILAAVYPELYYKTNKEELAVMVMENLHKRKYISKRATLSSHHWNVFPTHYIPKELRPDISRKFSPQVRMLHTTNMMFSIRDNSERWSKILLS